MSTSHPTRTKLLDAGQRLMLSRGFTATTVDEICAEAAVTKGGFFHHFKSKEQFGEAVLGHYRASTQRMLQGAPFGGVEDPLERLHGYLDLFVAVARNPEIEKSCLFGNIAQELASSHAELRAACALGFGDWARQIARDLDDVKRIYAPRTDFDSAGLAEHFIAIYEGSLILAKAKGDARVLETNVEHFRAYLATLVGSGTPDVNTAHLQKERSAHG
jgi:TetR/AcrR family transcriptional regulator, transcriptional repressor for nem operon